MHDLFPFAFLSIASIALFSFLTVSSWTDGRRKEREAYYKAETMKRLTEAQGNGAATVLEIIREEERIMVRRRRDGTRLGGLVTVATGLGLGIFLHAVVSEAPVYLIGVIPLLVGAALMVWSYLLTSQE
jgi:hypothetical protein